MVVITEFPVTLVTMRRIAYRSTRALAISNLASFNPISHSMSGHIHRPLTTSKLSDWCQYSNEMIWELQVAYCHCRSETGVKTTFKVGGS